jgi:hypothetical protein
VRALLYTDFYSFELLNSASLHSSYSSEHIPPSSLFIHVESCQDFGTLETKTYINLCRYITVCLLNQVIL